MSGRLVWMTLLYLVCSVSEGVLIKAAGGVRTLDDLLLVRALGIARVGATAGPTMLDEAVKRGFSDTPKRVEIKVEGAQLGGGY